MREVFMACDPELLKRVPLFSLLDAEERGVLAANAEVRHFASQERVFKTGDPGGKGFVLIEGKVRVTLVDDDQQDITVNEPDTGGFFGFASLLDGSAHQTSALALEAVTCLEINRDNLRNLLHEKPDAGMDMLAVVGRQFHATQRMVQVRSLKNANELIADQATTGDRVADAVARFGGSWRFIILFSITLVVYIGINVMLGAKSWDPYPFILLNLFLSMMAAVQAPVIMMSQNRQDTKDRMRGELDYDVNLRAESEIRGLSVKMHELSDKLSDVEELLRARTSGTPSV
jgi:CRP/FNR family cyclic AMP-dependent transcriptional regulator